MTTEEKIKDLNKKFANCLYGNAIESNVENANRCVELCISEIREAQIKMLEEIMTGEVATDRIIHYRILRAMGKLKLE